MNQDDCVMQDENTDKKKRPRLEATAPVDGGTGDDPPVYVPTHLAATVFNNPYFYKNKKHAEYFSDEREEVLGRLSVFDVYMKFTDGNEDKVDSGLTKLAYKIGAMDDQVIKYYAPVQLTVETRLASRKIIALGRSEELETFRQRSVDVPILDVSKEDCCR